jgi:hypothetical protein
MAYGRPDVKRREPKHLGPAGSAKERAGRRRGEGLLKDIELESIP